MVGIFTVEQEHTEAAQNGNCRTKTRKHSGNKAKIQLVATIQWYFFTSILPNPVTDNEEKITHGNKKELSSANRAREDKASFCMNFCYPGFRTIVITKHIGLNSDLYFTERPKRNNCKKWWTNYSRRDRTVVGWLSGNV